MLTHSQTRPFVWIAWLGVATTALNTLVPLASRTTARDLDALRDVVLLVHAPATLLPLLALSLLAFRRGPLAAVAVAAFTLMEKFLEFTGQALQLFPPRRRLAVCECRLSSRRSGTRCSSSCGSATRSARQGLVS